MNTPRILERRFFFVVLISATAFFSLIALTGWKGGPGSDYYRTNNIYDTIPGKKTEGEKDLDKELRKLEDAGKLLENLKMKDWSKIHQDIKEALKSIDIGKIRLQVDEALAKVDVDKIGAETERAIGEINFEKMHADIEKAMKDVPGLDQEELSEDLQRFRTELEQHFKNKEWRKELENPKKISMKEVERELEKAKLEMEKMKEELKLEKFDMKEIISDATGDLENAKAELKSYQEMIYKMENEGLLITTGDYLIEYNNGKLSVNGVRQNTDVEKRYKSYFVKDRVKIKKLNGDIKIDVD